LEKVFFSRFARFIVLLYFFVKYKYFYWRKPTKNDVFVPSQLSKVNS